MNALTEQIKRNLAVIKVVGQIDGHDVIRRASVFDNLSLFNNEPGSAAPEVESRPEWAKLRQTTTERLDEFFAGKPGYRREIDAYLRALEHEVNVLSGLTGYTYPAPIPFPAFKPRAEMEQYYVTSEQRPEPHLLIWGDGENEAEWCQWDGDSYEPATETVTGFWPAPPAAPLTPKANGRRHAEEAGPICPASSLGCTCDQEGTPEAGHRCASFFSRPMGI